MLIILEKDDPLLWVKKICAISMLAGLITTGFLGFGVMKIIQAKNQINPESSPAFELSLIQENSFLAISNPEDPIKPPKTLKMIVTAYSSTPWETDGDPFITASGKRVEQGIVANNLLPFGTQIRIPELYGDEIFVVQDRMHWRKGYYHLDIWFSEHSEAKKFGAKTTYIEVLDG